MGLSTVILLFCLFCYTLAEDTKCYWPNGEEAPSSYKPCGSSRTTFNNTCCYGFDLDSACLKNGLCLLRSGKIIRSACKSQDWFGCQEICPMEHSGEWWYLDKCKDGKYCCYRSLAYDCCNREAYRYTLKVPRKTPVAAIAGGTVGGVVGITLLLGFGWWFLRRRRAARKTPENNAVDQKSLKESQMMHPALAEASAGPDSVLVETDGRPIEPRAIHELAA